MSDAKTICERLILAADLADMGRKPEKNDYRRLAAALIEKQAIELSVRRTVSGQEAPICVDCGDGITAHNPGVCGTCYAMKYAAPIPATDAEKDATLTVLSGLVHAYVGLCRDSGIDPGMNTQYRNARAILAANKEPKP